MRPIPPLEIDEHTRNRFNYSYDKTEAGCWEWKGYLTNGYGTFRMPKGHSIRAHKLSYLMHKGEIADGLVVCHACDNRKCVNPEHLFLGTHQDNMDDMKAKGRSAKRIGKPRAYPEATRRRIFEMWDAGFTGPQIADEVSLPVETVYGVLKRRRTPKQGPRGLGRGSMVTGGVSEPLGAPGIVPEAPEGLRQPSEDLDAS